MYLGLNEAEIKPNADLACYDRSESSREELRFRRQMT